MTGESDELKKDSLENCLAREKEKEAENLYHKTTEKDHHDIPSPILLSGT
jgi:hypothetical protein